MSQLINFLIYMMTMGSLFIVCLWGTKFMPVPAHLMISPPPLKCGTEKVNKEFMLLLLEDLRSSLKERS